ncbi:metallophosphoesterase [Cohnella sp. CFH 77786]|uniref:metallophosphoesterase family protein n=1 Tax=Cohnella sp. CFH 77786 TaxID=2662265 RepID=UPI001C60C1DE|nr:metallophosphoesterase [Cohnella sp. CFH 77786]MBW5448760.1 metallophosphoesterase [Cohnella sp. CFH 77786]
MMHTDVTRPLLSFQVITDTHVTVDPNHPYNLNLERALQDIAENAPGSCGIMHAGDVTDHGFPAEYEEMKRIWNRWNDRLPPLYFTMGNHDVALGEWSSRLSDFLTATGMTAAYHDHWICGYHFIFLGTEQGLELFCKLSEEQLAWLDAKLGEDASPGKPVFVFLHQPLKDTVAGTVEPHKWYGVTEDEELKRVLSKHRQAILFTGHGHWELGSPLTYYDGAGKLPAMFNAASVAYLWTDEDERKEGSQGYYVEVYADHVRVRGRDFSTGKWVEAAQFRVDDPFR